MLLTPVQGIRETLGFDDMTDINAAIEAALHAAEPQLAAMLDTSFERASYVDTFWVNQPGFRIGLHAETEFRLRRGLLVGDPTIAVTTDVSLFGSGSETTFVPLRVDTNKGVVKNAGTRFDRQYVRISYTAGFEVDGSDPKSYDITQVPSWLQEAAKLKCFTQLADSPMLTEAGVKLDAKVLDAQFSALINSKIRYAPSALLPM